MQPTILMVLSFTPKTRGEFPPDASVSTEDALVSYNFRMAFTKVCDLAFDFLIEVNNRAFPIPG